MMATKINGKYRPKYTMPETAAAMRALEKNVLNTNPTMMLVTAAISR